MSAFTSWLAAATDLALPRRCAGCGRAATWWCAACARVLDRPPRVLEVPVDAIASAAAVASSPVSCLRVAVVAPYRGPAGAALLAWKARGVLALGDPLAGALARAVHAVAADLADVPVLVPVPSRAAAVRVRGADVVAELARACAARCGSGVRVVPALAHARPVLDQAGLTPAARAENLAGALRVRGPARGVLAGRTVVLVDDVLTTGSSLIDARRAVLAAAPGVAGVLAATVAAAGSFGPLLPDGRTG